MILLVEPGVPLVRLMGWFLTEAGLEITRVDHASEIIDAVRESWPDVVVLNTTVPADEKRQHVESLRQASSALKVLDVSDGAGHELPQTTADAYLMLPFDADDLVDAVRQLGGG